MPYVTASHDVHLHVKDWGAGQPVILIHGWPLCADSWDEQAFALAQAGFRVIAYDRRGFGRSSQPWDGYDYDTLADDLAAIVDYAGSCDLSLVGFSMGGGEIARYMSRHRGDSVSKTALISSVVPYMVRTDDNPDGVKREIFDQIASSIALDRPKFFATFLKDYFGVGFSSHPASDERVQWAWAQAMQASLKSTLACAASISSTDFRKDLSSFRVPTLVVHGTSDRTVPIDATGRVAAREIAGARFVEYAGAPHGLFATESRRLSEDLIAFLR
jgi:non-heme chloroperoxidase